MSQLQERIQSLLFERTAISEKPEHIIRQDISRLPSYALTQRISQGRH